MSHFKSFLLGVGVAYGAYYITRKGIDGRSVLDDLLDNPKDFLEKAKKQALTDVAEKVKEL